MDISATPTSMVQNQTPRRGLSQAVSKAMQGGEQTLLPKLLATLTVYSESRTKHSLNQLLSQGIILEHEIASKT